MVTKQDRNEPEGLWEDELVIAVRNLRAVLERRAVERAKRAPFPIENKYAKPKAKHMGAVIDMVMTFQNQKYIRTCEEFLFMVSGDDEWKGWRARITAGYRDPYDKNSFTALRNGRYGDVSDDWIASLHEILKKDISWWQAKILEIRDFRRNNKNVTSEHQKKGKEGSFHKALMEIKENLLACAREECKQKGLK